MPNGLQGVLVGLGNPLLDISAGEFVPPRPHRLSQQCVYDAWNSVSRPD